MSREQRIDLSRPLGPLRGEPGNLERPADLNAEFSAWTRHPRFAELLARDQVAIPAVEDREGYNPGEDYQYWVTGFADYINISRLLPADFLERQLSILDFGGCTGRVARHFLAAQPTTQITIAEANVNYVNWVNAHFGNQCRALKIGPQPGLPLPDNSFDFAFALSVFTHIDTDESAWLTELMRVLKPQGYLYVTVLCEHSWQAMDRESLLATIKAEYEPNQDLAAAIGGPMPRERISVALEFNDVIDNCNTFHSCSYLRRVWSRFATIDRIVPLHHGNQTAVLLRKGS